MGPSCADDTSGNGRLGMSLWVVVGLFKKKKHAITFFVTKMVPES
jgi:hypothetical protein